MLEQIITQLFVSTQGGSYQWGFVKNKLCLNHPSHVLQQGKSCHGERSGGGTSASSVPSLWEGSTSHNVFLCRVGQCGSDEASIRPTFEYVKEGHKGEEKNLISMSILGWTGANELSVQQRDSAQT